MDGVDPEKVATRATQEREKQRSHAKTVLEWLLADGHLGEMYPRGDLITELASQTDLTREQAAFGVRGTVGDVVDPVQQVTVGNEKYVGVIEYRTYPGDGAYGYVQYHDRLGERKRVVCAKCVEEADLEENVAHATEGGGTAPADCGWDVLLERVEAHYDDAHDGVPNGIEPGASLLSNTTIGGNTAFHAGNDGPGSGLDADKLQGSGPSAYLDVLRQTTEPSDTDALWLDTNTSPPILKSYGGVDWVNAIAKSDLRGGSAGRSWTLIDTFTGGLSQETFNLADTYQSVELVFNGAKSSLSGSVVRISVNGDKSDNYDYTFNDGDNRSTGRPYINLAPNDKKIEGSVIRLTGTWQRFFRAMGMARTADDTINYGRSTSANSPLDSITFNQRGNTPEVDLEIWGRK